MTPLCNIPQLETARLTLRTPQVEEFDTYCALFTSERAQYMGVLDAKRAWREYAAEIGHWALFGYGPWHVLRKDDGALVGAVAFLNHAEQPEVELGWHLYDGFEGHGYATEAAQAARDWGFANLGLKTFVSYIHPENMGSVAVAERLGALADSTAARIDAEDLVYRHLAPEGLQ